MDINGYVVEVMVKARLAELRADAARHVALASASGPRRSAWAALRSALQRTARRGLVSPRHA